MKFRTELEWINPFDTIGFDTKLLFLGSCFAENIGARFKATKFDTAINPNGIIFQPIVLADLIERAIKNKPIEETDLVLRDGFYYSWLHHGSICGENKRELLEQLNAIQTEFLETLKSTHFLFITFGTAYGYRLKSTQQIVANCHKIPSAEFKKTLASSEAIYEKWTSLLEALFSLKPKLKVYLTVSPVRHIKDGIIENNLSKAALISATHTISGNFEEVSYLPAYEWVMDDLRDYRFYKSDLVHPNQMAQDYIWDKVAEQVFDAATATDLKKVSAICSNLKHKPFQAKSEKHLNFLKHTKQLIESLPNHISTRFSGELITLNNMLNESN